MKKIIDVHVHTFPEKIASHALKVLSGNSHTRPFSDGTLRGLSESMAEAGVTVSIIQPVATKPEQVKSINDSSIKINSTGESTGIFSFGAMHPDFVDFDYELSRISEAGIKGIKIHPVYQGVAVDDERYVKIIERAGELGLFVMFHAGFDIGFPGNDFASPERISRALDRAGNCRVILAHMGGWKCWDDAVKFFAKRENVWIDTAFSLGKFTPNGDGYYSGGEDCMMLSDDEFIEIVRTFGSDRVLFGTDSPWASQKKCVEAIISLELTEIEKEKIFNQGLGLVP